MTVKGVFYLPDANEMWSLPNHLTARFIISNIDLESITQEWVWLPLPWDPYVINEWPHASWGDGLFTHHSLPVCGSRAVELRASATATAKSVVTRGEEEDGGLQGRRHRRDLGPVTFLPSAVLKNAGRTTPEDAAHSWRRIVEQISQQHTTVMKPGEQNYTQRWPRKPKSVIIDIIYGIH